MATIYDVAKLAGVSIGTVSNYLNHKYVGTTRSRAIQKAIEELNYTPNHIARSLKTNIISEILLILPNLSEGIYNELANTIIQEMHQRGYRIHLELSNNSAREEKKLLDTGFSATYSAVLLCTSNPNDEKTFQRLQSLKPLIFLLRRPNGMEDSAFSALIILESSTESPHGCWNPAKSIYLSGQVRGNSPASAIASTASAMPSPRRISVCQSTASSPCPFPAARYFVQPRTCLHRGNIPNLYWLPPN